MPNSDSAFGVSSCVSESVLLIVPPLRLGPPPRPVRAASAPRGRGSAYPRGAPAVPRRVRGPPRREAAPADGRGAGQRGGVQGGVRFGFLIAFESPNF